MSTHHQRWLRAFENLPLIAILRGITTEECVDVAAASRGLFGLGRAIDRNERDLLVQIGESLGARALARVDERLRGG